MSLIILLLIKTILIGGYKVSCMIIPLIKSLLGVLERIVNDVKCLVKHFHMVQTQLEIFSNVQKDLLANNAKQDIQAYGIKTGGGTHTQDPLYPEGHPKRIELKI